MERLRLLLAAHIMAPDMRATEACSLVVTAAATTTMVVGLISTEAKEDMVNMVLQEGTAAMEHHRRTREIVVCLQQAPAVWLLVPLEAQ